jgi:[ribosomal protein S5]-alanine N-acetyltransferase
MQLETRRLRLREFTAGDWQHIHAYRCDPRYLRSYHRKSIASAETQEMIRESVTWQSESPRLRFQFAMETRTTETLIGNCGLRQDGIGAAEANIGFELDSDYWNQGYASEAVHALLGFGFRDLDLQRIWGWCLTDNTRSARVMEKCGLRLERREPGQELIGNKHYDILVYAITIRDWKKTRRKYPEKEHGK